MDVDEDVDDTSTTVSLNKSRMFLGDGRSKSANKQRQQQQQQPRPSDPFPGQAPLPTEQLLRHKLGGAASSGRLATAVHSTRSAKAEKELRRAETQAARLDLLRQEAPGAIELEPGEAAPSQRQLQAAVPLAAAAKRFSLALPRMGPYRAAYSRNGRFLALAGRRGHLSVVEWPIRKLHCETGVQEQLRDVCFLQGHNMVAAAQQRWTHVYDNQGLELHCLKGLFRALRLEFLPYHLLLAAGCEDGALHYVDVSTGQLTASYLTHHGPLRVLAQNPVNAALLSGNASGTVCMWTPNEKRPVLKLLAHERPVTALAVEPRTGTWLASAGVDLQLRLWDLRRLDQPLRRLKLPASARHLAVSQRGVLAAALAQEVLLFNDLDAAGDYEHDVAPLPAPLLRQRFAGEAASLAFCPFEDVLGVGHGRGFDALLVPGAGEACPDGLEGGTNPLETRAQRREAQVKTLLDKVPAELIDVTSGAAPLTQLDRDSLPQEMEKKRALLLGKVPKVDFTPRHRKKGAGKTGKLQQRKEGVRLERKQFALSQLLKKRATEKRVGDGGRAPRRKKVLLSKAPGRALTGALLDRLIPATD